MKLSYTTPDFFPRFSISKIIYLCDFFIVSPSIFRSWMVLFFPSYLFVFSCNFSRELFISHLKCPISIKRSTFKSKTCFSSVLGFLGLAVVVLCLLGFCWQCFFFLPLPFTIYLSLVLIGPTVSVWSLSLLRSCIPFSASLGDLSSHGTEGWVSAQFLWQMEPERTMVRLLWHSCVSCPPGHTRVWQSLKQKWHFYL